MSHVFLTGFMGAGKTTVGRLVAETLARPFVDLDVEIEHREGESIASLFRMRGETGFREAEHAALAALSAASPAVIATGGGVVLRADNQTLLKKLGTVVYLAVTPEEAIARLGDAADRPLLAGGGLDAARSILDARLAVYTTTADVVIDTVGRSAHETAAAVVEALRARASAGETRCVRVGAADDPAGYDIVIAPGLLAHVGERVAHITGSTAVALVADATVWSLFGQRVKGTLIQSGLRVHEYVFAPGEGSKSWAEAGRMLESFASAGLERDACVVALGGGVVGDLAGFAAATFMRGVALVHVPTTLLAQVDSAIGGKTAVDLAAGKNLAGAFWPPRLVLADTDTLATLSAAEWTNGLVEVVKTAILAGEAALADLEDGIDAVMVRESQAVVHAVTAAARFKAGVVFADLREGGLRECLNLGHTLGHALELLAGYGTLSHGLAVAEGMRFALMLGALLGGATDPAFAERSAGLLERVGAGARVCANVLRDSAATLDPETVLGAMRGDKKSRGGLVRFVILDGPGRWRVEAVEDDVILTALTQWRSVIGV